MRKHPLVAAALIAAVVVLGPGPAAGRVSSGANPDLTPLSCDGKPADFHAERAKKIARKGYGLDRILDPSPLAHHELVAFRGHRRCLEDQHRRHRVGAYLDRRRAKFDGRFYVLISPPGSGWLASTRSCENGGSYGDDGNGDAYLGAYQFDARSWSATAGTYEGLTGLPADPSRLAAPREQDIRASIWYRTAGAGAWPVCG